jgi:hypothetical protein
MQCTLKTTADASCYCISEIYLKSTSQYRLKIPYIAATFPNCGKVPKPKIYKWKLKNVHFAKKKS